MSDTEQFITHSIAPGINLSVRKDYGDEDHIYDVIRACKVVMLDRPAALARLKECIAELAKIDEERGGDETGLVSLSEGMGWLSNHHSHTTGDYKRALTALADALDDGDLVDALDVAEFEVTKAIGGAA